MMNTPPAPGQFPDRRHAAVRPAFSLVEVLIVIAIIVVLISLILPTISVARERANRLKCASNLRQLGLAMSIYAQSQRNRELPRTIYNPKKKQLQLGNAGFGLPDTYSGKGYVDDNNVPASLFVLFRYEELRPQLFICPSTAAEPAFVQTSPKLSSNWELIPLNMTYSLAVPFPSQVAAQTGYSWRYLLPPDFALLADINPGTRGGDDPPNNSVGPRHDATSDAMAAANSNNHRNKGQNVLFGDGRVEFETTPYCGMYRPSIPFRDNIYTAGSGDGGDTSDTALPVDKFDSVLLPTDDPGGK